jgi:hypothetical protein
MRQPSMIAEPVRLGSRPGFIPPRVGPRSLLLVLAIVTGTALRGRRTYFTPVGGATLPTVWRGPFPYTQKAYGS